MIVDRNELQSDKPTEEILALGDLEAKLRAFGWHVAIVRRPRSRGAAPRVRATSASGGDRAEGAGREHDQGQGRLVHGAPCRAARRRRHLSLACRRSGRRSVRARACRARSTGFGSAFPTCGSSSVDEADRGAHVQPRGRARVGCGDARRRSRTSTSPQAYGEELLELAERHPELVVLDADLASDCRIRPFELAHPERFHESGIAEQDMVSTAAGMARQGLLPVVNSFASFLAARANEQIYNQASERTKVDLCAALRGADPGRPGQVASECARRLPARCAAERHGRAARELGRDEGAVALGRRGRGWRTSRLRLAIGPSPRRIELDRRGGRRPAAARSSARARDALLFAYGPVMLHEALSAAEALEQRGTLVQVVNMPWLNRVDAGLARELVEPFEEHLRRRGPRAGRRAGDALRRALDGRCADGVRRRGLAGVRDAARGAALPRPRRLLARRPHRACAARTHGFVTPVWLVLPDPFSSRLFFDTGIVDRPARATR